MNSDFVEDKITCWENCVNHVDCLWFSFRSVNQLCILFATCPEIIENPEFISGEKECNYLHEYGMFVNALLEGMYICIIDFFIIW